MAILATKKTAGGTTGDIFLDGAQAWEVDGIINAGAGWYSWRKRTPDAAIVRATGVAAVDLAMLLAAVAVNKRILIDDRDAPLTLAPGGFIELGDTFIESYAGMARVNLSNNTILQLGDYLNAAVQTAWSDCTVSADGVTITSATLTDVVVGDLLIISSADNIATVWPHYTGGQTRPGEIAVVEYISGTTYVLNRQLGDTYTITPKVAVLKRSGVGGINPLATRCGLANLDFTGSNNTSGANTVGIITYTAYKPIFENLILDKCGSLYLQTSLGGELRGIIIDGQEDGHLDYGIAFVFSDQCVVDGYEGRNVRHHATTGGMGNPIRYGSNYANVVRNARVYASGMASPALDSSIAFDTHAESLKMRLEHINVYLGGNGTVSPSVGTSLIAFQSRGRATKWLDCHVHGISTAKHRGWHASSSPDCEIDMCSMDGGWAGVHAELSTATAPGSNNITIRRSKFNNIRNEGILLDGVTGALIEDNDIINCSSQSSGLWGPLKRACISVYDRYTTGIGDIVIRNNRLPKTTNLIAFAQQGLTAADVVFEDNDVQGYGACNIGLDRTQTGVASIEIKYNGRQKGLSKVSMIQQTAHGLDAVGDAWAPITDSHIVFDDVTAVGTVTGMLLDVTDANTYCLATHGDLITFPDSVLPGSYNIAANGRDLYWDASAVKWNPVKPGDSSANSVAMLRVENYQDSYITAKVVIGSSIGPIVGRDGGEDNLGEIVGPVTVNFDTGSFDNKRLLIGISAIPLTFAATRVKRYGLTVKQDELGDRLIAWQNATWLGAAQQPATGANTESHYEVFFSGGNYFVQRVA